jgi:hypothetical protein
VTDSDFEAIRIRAEGALEVALAAERELRRIFFAISAENWREALRDAAEFASGLPAIRAACDQLEALRIRDGWPEDAPSTRVLISLQFAYESCAGAVALRLRQLGVDRGAPKLEDAIAQLRARSAAVPPKSRDDEEVALTRLMFGLAVIMFALSPAYSASFATGMIPLIGLMLTAWQVSRVGCPECEEPFFGAQPLSFVRSMIRGRCCHCGHRPR